MTDRVYLSHGGMKASIYFTEVHPPNPFQKAEKNSIRIKVGLD